MAIKTKKLEKNDSAIEAKKNAAERRREKAQAIANKFSGGNEPSIDPFNYRISLIRCLNWYNVSVDYKEIRGYFNSYLINTNRKKLIPIFNQMNDLYIRSAGILCRLKARDQYLEPQDEQQIELRIENLLKDYVPDVSVLVVEDKPKTKIDKTKELSSIHYEVLEGVIDDFIKHKKSDFDSVGYMKSKEVPAAAAKEIGSYYKNLLDELEVAQTDLEEYGYLNWKKSQFKKYIEFVKAIVDSCNQQTISSKVRAPRKKKAVSPTKLVAKLKYAKEYSDLEVQLKSIKPESIIDSTELWVYNTKYRKLAVYKAEKNGKLSIKGTTVLGFDIKESQQVMLRKPDEFFRTTQLAKRALATSLKDIKTRPVTPNGRINEETILLGAF